MISPNLQEFFIDKDTNLPLTEGYVYYYSDIARSNLKTVYEINGNPGSYGYTALPNPLQLSGAGTTVNSAGNDIRVYYYPYDEQGNIELYYIVVKDKFGNTKLNRPAWPNLICDSGISTFAYNFVRNSTFYSWSNGTEFDDVKSGSVSLTDFMVDDWTYSQDDPSQTIQISQGVFAAGDDSVPGNPPFYLNYVNSSAGNAAGTFNHFQQTYRSVQTLNSKNVAVSIWVKQTNTGALPGQFSVTLTQYFGTGGSPSATPPPTTILTVPGLTIGSFVNYTGSVLLPSIVGKSIGTNGDDKLILSLEMPLNQTASIQINDVRLEEGSEVVGDQEISNDDMAKQTDAFGYYPPFTTGDVKLTLKNTATTGWLMMDDGTIGNPLSNATHVGFANYALYNMIWNNVHNLYYTPMYESNGDIVTTFGATSKDDWLANRKLSLTKALGRVLSGAGQASYFDIVTGAATVSTDPGYVTLNSIASFNFFTGTAVKFSVQGAATLPSPLNSSTTYYIYASTSTRIYLFDTEAHAVLAATSGSPPTTSSPGVITLTTNGSGTFFMSVTMANMPFGSFAGEDTHPLTVPENPSHSHPGSTGSYIDQSIDSGGGDERSPVNAGTPGSTSFTLAVAAQGGSLPHNNVQPTTFMNVMIKL